MPAEVTTAALTKITLREANIDDADILARLISEMDDETHNPMNVVSGADMRETLTGMAAYPNFKAYILEDDGTPIATFSLMVFTSPSHQGAVQAMLDAVVVTRACRSRGIGKILIQHALDIAAMAGSYKMTLSSNLKRAGAHRFYEHNGFRQHGISFGIALSAPVAG